MITILNVFTNLKSSGIFWLLPFIDYIHLTKVTTLPFDNYSKSLHKFKILGYFLVVSIPRLYHLTNVTTLPYDNHSKSLHRFKILGHFLVVAIPRLYHLIKCLLSSAKSRRQWSVTKWEELVLLSSAESLSQCSVTTLHD